MAPCMRSYSGWASLKILGWCRRVAAEEAPKKAARSLTFLLTIVRHLASSLARAPGESLLEANLLEASLQVGLCGSRLRLLQRLLLSILTLASKF